ncbi:MAG: hypothetical protein R2713_09980 [Ilumatobacteraceae bacterium]
MALPRSCCTSSIELIERATREPATLAEHPSGPLPVVGGGPVLPARRGIRWPRLIVAGVAWIAVGAALAVAWTGRRRLIDTLWSWWPLVAVAVVAAAVVVAIRSRPAPPKSAAHPALAVRRSPQWPYRPVPRPLGRRVVPNVVVDGDTFARTAWPTAEIEVSRRWSIDASERVAGRFGTEVAVVVGADGAGAAGRRHVRVTAVPADGTIEDAIWELVTGVDPRLPMLFVSDDEVVTRAAVAHGAQVMSCRSWMALADRIEAG